MSSNETNKKDDNKLETTLSDIHSLNIIDYLDDESLNEMVFSSKNDLNVTINKLAYLDTVDVNKLAREDLFSKYKSYKDISLYDTEESNNGLKLRIQREFLKNPRLHISNAISKILNSVATDYNVDEDTKNKFLNVEREADRKDLIIQLQQKQDKTNLKLIQAFAVCDDLLVTLKKAEEYNKKTNSFKNNAETTLNNEIDNIFKKEFLDDSFLKGNVKNDIYQKIKEFDFKNENNLPKEEHSKLYNKLIDTVSKDLTPYFNQKEPKEDYNDTTIRENAKNIVENLEKIKDINNDINKYTMFMSNLNTQVKLTKKFTSINKMFVDIKATKKEYDNIQEKIKILQEDKDKEAVDSILKNYHKLNQKEVISLLEDKLATKKDYGEFLLNNLRNSTMVKKGDVFVADDSIIFDKEIQNSLNKIFSQEHLDFNKTIKSIDKSNLRLNYLKNIIDDSLTRALNNDFGYNFSQDEKKQISNIVLSNLDTMNKKYLGAVNKKDGSYNFLTSSTIFNDFQKYIYNDLIKNVALKDDDKDNSSVRDIKNKLQKVDTNILSSKIDGTLKDEIVDIVNFNNILDNNIINKAVGDGSEIDKVVKQSLFNNNLKTFAKDIHNKKMSEVNKKEGHIKKDMDLDEHIRNVATKKFDNLANKILSNSLHKTLMSAHSFIDLNNCVKSSTIRTTGNETRYGSLKGCIEKYLDKIEQDSKELQSIIQRSVQGIGGWNPFAGIIEIIALYKSVDSKRHKRQIQEMIANINKVAVEISSATNELERKARAYLSQTEDNANMFMVSTHDSELNVFAREIKQEYLAQVLAEFKNNNQQINFDTLMNDELISGSLHLEKKFLNELQGLSDEEFKKVIESSRDNLEKIGVNADDINSFEDLKQNNLDNISSISVLKNVKFSSLTDEFPNLKQRETDDILRIYKSDITLEEIRRLDLIQTKLKEYDILNVDVLQFLEGFEKDTTLKDNPTKEEFNRHLLKNWLIDNKIPIDYFNDVALKEAKAIYEKFMEDGKKEPKDWEQLKKDLANSIKTKYPTLENQKNMLIYRNLFENLEEQKEFLLNQERILIDKKNQFSKLHSKFKHINSYLEIKEAGIDEVEYNKYIKLQNDIAKIEETISNDIRPADRIEETITTLKSLLNQGTKITSLEKRNAISNAINLLSRGSHTVENIDSICEYLSCHTDFYKDEKSGDKTIITITTKEKGHLSKIYESFDSDNTDIRYHNKEAKEYIEKARFTTDKLTMEGTEQAEFITPITRLSELKKSFNKDNKNNQSVAEDNRNQYKVYENLTASQHYSR